MSLCVGAIVGGLDESLRAPHRALNVIFFTSALGYLSVSLIDFREHFVLHHRETGRWLGWSVVTIGESINHVLTTLTIIGILVLARPIPAVMETRDWFVVVAPGLFGFLGWRDEIVYHRKRCDHREDMMHTVAHLGAGVMLTSFYALRLTGA